VSQVALLNRKQSGDGEKNFIAISVT